MKKSSFMYVLLAACLTGAAGCSTGAGGEAGAGGDKTAVQEAPPVQEDKTPITIQYWHSHPDSQMDGLKMIIADFNKKYPYITIEPVFQGAYPELAQKLVTAVAAKNVPAVTVAENSVMPGLAYNGVLADLGPYIKRDKVDVNDFSKGMIDAYAFTGKQYGIPFVVSMNTLLYNKTMFEKEGVKVPETWADIEAMQKLVKKDGNKFTRYGMTVNFSQQWDLEPWQTNGGGSLFSKDGKLSALDQPESYRFMQKFLEWKSKGILYVTHGVGALDTAKQMFLDEQLGMFQISSSGLKWYADNAKFEIGADFIPGDKKRVAEIGGAALVIPDLAPQKQKEAAWKFVQFATAAENNIKYVDALGYFPTHKSVFNSAQGQDFFKRNPYVKSIFDHFDDVVSRPQTPAFAETKLPTQAIFDRIVLQNMDVEASFKQGAKEVNEILKNYK